MTYNGASHRDRLLELLKGHYNLEELRTLCFILESKLPDLTFDNLPGETLEAKARELIQFAERRSAWAILLTGIRQQRDDLASYIDPLFPQGQLRRLFICYKRHAAPDQELAIYLRDTLEALGHKVNIDLTMRTGDDWLDQIDQQIQTSDFLIVLLSKASAESEMVRAEIHRAYEYRQVYGKPFTLPVRIGYEGMLPYAIAAVLGSLHYVVWQSQADNERLVQEILAAIAGRLPSGTSARPSLEARGIIISEDGRAVADDETLHPPSPEFDPRLLKDLPVPGGAVRLRDKFYVEREADAQLKDQIVKWGSTTTIRAPRQTGKTSLLTRGIHHSRELGASVVFLDFQGWGRDQLASLDIFLRELAESICDELDLDERMVEEAWSGRRGASQKLLRFMEKCVLPAFDEPIILAMDEADALLQTNFYRDFFGLLRSWHNRRASRQDWEKLNLVLVISTEPYLLIDDIHQSPFNVGLYLNLADFDETQVYELNRRHGSPVAQHNLPHFMTLLHGHPFLTRRALYVMVTEGMTWSELTRNAAKDHGPFADHLRRQYWGIRDKPQLKEALKEIIRIGRCSDEIALFRLLRSGLVESSGKVCTCRCDLYRLYFEDRLF